METPTYKRYVYLYGILFLISRCATLERMLDKDIDDDLKFHFMITRMYYPERSTVWIKNDRS